LAKKYGTKIVKSKKKIIMQQKDYVDSFLNDFRESPPPKIRR